ncbi:site-specific integrase [Nocardiopsis dassonvillei]|uniref:site-specific integrase n=1 Tax=Nocardiopsis dassonvillei TaxID=2014 RepID=UPI00157C0C72|nr:tyrosine-type recombinase/integrase [Nocardiopsis dassonvillei]
MSHATTNRMLVEDYLDTVRLRGRSPKTVGGYQYTLARYLDFLADTAATEATPRVVRRYLSQVASQHAATVVARTYGDLRAFYRWMIREGEITVSPLASVDAPSAPLPPVGTIDAATLRALISVRGRGPFLDRRNRLLVLLLTDTGLRAGELCGICVRDINLTASTVTIRGKSGYRTIGFGSRTAIELRRYLRVRAGHRFADRSELFLTSRGPLGVRGLGETITSLCKRAGVDHVHPHKFRHSWATAQMQTEAGELTVMVAGGWASTKHMQRYVREATARRAAALNQQHSLVDGL